MFLYDSHNLDIPACEEKKERKKEKKEKKERNICIPFRFWE